MFRITENFNLSNCQKNIQFSKILNLENIYNVTFEKYLIISQEYQYI